MSDAAQAPSWKPYAAVFAALIALTVLTVALAGVDAGMLLGLGEGHHAVNILVGLLVAGLKAGLVVWIFMHMNHESGVNRFILAFSVALMAVAFVAFCFDFVWLGTYAQSFAAAALGGH